MFHPVLQLKILLVFSTLGIVAKVTRPCVDMSSRQEVRTISPDDRVRLLDEFKRLRRVMGPRRFTIAMASSQLCDIVRRLDRALTPKSMPYWNARWDLRLPTPAESVLFSENFFSNTRVRREAKKKKSKDSFPRGLTTHFRRLNISASLTSAIRANRAAQLLIILYHLGQWREDDGGCEECTTSLMAFCDFQKQECLSGIVESADCSGFSAIDPCYASKCTNGICLAVPEKLLADFRSTPTRGKKLAERAATARGPVPTTTTTTTTTTSTTTTLPPTTTTTEPFVDDVECILIVAVGDDEELDSDDPITEFWGSTGSISKPSQSGTNTPAPSHISIKPPDAISTVHDNSRDFYNVSSTDLNVSGGSRPGATSATTVNESSPVSTTLTPNRNTQQYFNPRLNTWVYPFNATLPFPSVYFSISVIAGAYRSQPRPQRLVTGVTVVSRGANLPSGYTHVIEALSLTDGHVVRVPDPIASGVGVEFFLIVLHNGRECDRMCLSRRRYVKCNRPTVRMSRYRSLTDPIIYYKTPKQAIEHQWKGAGSYRRRTQDPFVFTCFIE